MNFLSFTFFLSNCISKCNFHCCQKRIITPGFGVDTTIKCSFLLFSLVCDTLTSDLMISMAFIFFSPVLRCFFFNWSMLFWLPVHLSNWQPRTVCNFLFSHQKKLSSWTKPPRYVVWPFAIRWYIFFIVSLIASVFYRVWWP